MQTFLKHLHFLHVKKNITGNKVFICCLSGLDTIYFKQKTFGMFSFYLVTLYIKIIMLITIWTFYQTKLLKDL